MVIVNSKGKRRCGARAWAWVLVFVGQKEGGHAAISFRDDQEGVVAKTFTRPGFINLDKLTAYGFLEPWLVQLQLNLIRKDQMQVDGDKRRCIKV